MKVTIYINSYKMSNLYLINGGSSLISNWTGQICIPDNLDLGTPS